MIIHRVIDKVLSLTWLHWLLGYGHEWWTSPQSNSRKVRRSSADKTSSKLL